MKNRSIGLGIFILISGVILLLIQLNIITWATLFSLEKLWPLFFIIAGVNIIFKNNQMVKIISWVLFIIVLVTYGFFVEGKNHGKENIKDMQNIKIEKVATTKNGELKLKLGAMSLDIGSTNTNLVDARVSDRGIKNSINYINGKETAVVKFEKDRYFTFWGKRGKDDCRIYLNKDIIWDLDIDAGAINSNIDLQELKVNKIDMDAGAGNFEIKFGKKQEYTFVKLDAGASKFNFYVPKDSGIRVKMDGGLNDTDFNGLNIEKQGAYYITPNYNNAASKIEFDVDMGVGKFEITARD